MDILEELEGFTKAYDERLFTKFSAKELKENSVLISRAAMAMGNHLSQWFVQAIGEITTLRAKLAECEQPTPSKSEPVEWNFEYNQLTEEFVHELDDKTAITISGFNRGYWAQYFNSKPQPTSQDELIKTDNTQVILNLQEQLAEITKQRNYWQDTAGKYAIDEHEAKEQLVAAEIIIETMRNAAQALIDRWNSPSWKDVPHTADFILALEKAIQTAAPKG